MTNEKHFLKTIRQWEVDYGLFTNLPRIVKFTNFSPSSFKLKRGILPLLTKYVSQLGNYLSYQAKIFLWTWLLKNLLLAKYLISAAAPLSNFLIRQQKEKWWQKQKNNPLQISTIIWKWGWKKAFVTNFLFLRIHPNPPPLSSQNLQS